MKQKYLVLILKVLKSCTAINYTHIIFSILENNQTILNMINDEELSVKYIYFK